MSYHVFSVFSECNYSEKGIKCTIENFSSVDDVIYIRPESRVSNYAFNSGATNIGKHILKLTSKGMKVEVTEIKKKESLWKIKSILKEVLTMSEESDISNKMSQLNHTEKSIVKHTVSGLSPHEVAIKMNLPLYAVYGLRYELFDKLKIYSRDELLLMFGKVNMLILK